MRSRSLSGELVAPGYHMPACEWIAFYRSHAPDIWDDVSTILFVSKPKQEAQRQIVHIVCGGAAQTEIRSQRAIRALVLRSISPD
jgi:hypothetical protein